MINFSVHVAMIDVCQFKIGISYPQFHVIVHDVLLKVSNVICNMVHHPGPCNSVMMHSFVCACVSTAWTQIQTLNLAQTLIVMW